LEKFFVCDGVGVVMTDDADIGRFVDGVLVLGSGKSTAR
jgi:hypothetical protein